MDEGIKLRVPSHIEARTLYTKEAILAWEKHSLILLVGGSKSGKSTLAEQIAVEAAKYFDSSLHYLATLRPGKDKENLRRIELHRAQRAGKGFESWECPNRLKDLEGLQLNNSILLLECLGNFVANAMFEEGFFEGKRPDPKAEYALADSLCEEILKASRQTDQFILVSNDISSDCVNFDEGSLAWRRLIGQCHMNLLHYDQTAFIEVSAGQYFYHSGSGKEER